MLLPIRRVTRNMVTERDLFFRYAKYFPRHSGLYFSLKALRPLKLYMYLTLLKMTAANLSDQKDVKAVPTLAKGAIPILKDVQPSSFAHKNMRMNNASIMPFGASPR